MTNPIYHTIARLQCGDGCGGGSNMLLLLLIFFAAWLIIAEINRQLTLRGVKTMNKRIITISVAIILAVLVGIMISSADKPTDEVAATTDVQDSPVANTEVAEKIPTLLDLGAKECVPCKMMAPILDELKADYAEKFNTVFIDVWEDSDQATKYGIKSIPTQIFFDAGGNELFRHEGFMSKEDILAKWNELGFEFE